MSKISMNAKDNIKITIYEPWMREQIIRMICQEYGWIEADQETLMKHFYESPYQREKSIRIAALDGKKVVGFQSFFRWPYLLDGIPTNTYQSGNSVVDSNYRRRGIFGRLLDYLNEIKEDKLIDCLIGFPVKASFNSFIYNKWFNTLNLSWYIKIISPFSIVKKINLSKLSLDTTPAFMPDIPNSQGFTLNRDSEFEIWRKNYSKGNDYFYFNYYDASNHIQFDLKVNQRGRLKELVVGGIRTNCDDLNFLKKAVKTLVKKVRGQHAFTFLSVALNNRHIKSEILMTFQQSGFRRIKKEIFFIVKDYKLGDKVYRPELWELYRRDVDTW